MGDTVGLGLENIRPVGGDGGAADRKNLRLMLDLGDLLGREIEREVRIARQQWRLHHRVQHRMPVGRTEAAAKGVEGQPELIPAPHLFVDQRHGIEAPVRRRRREIHGGALWVFRRRDDAAVGAACQVDFPIPTERWSADANLRGFCRHETGQHDAPFIRDAVAVVVLQIQNIRGARDKDAAAPDDDAVGIGQAGGKLAATIIAAVAIRIL